MAQEIEKSKRITDILKQYVSERIPEKVTNILFQLFNAVHAMFVNLEYRIDIRNRERNILTAQYLSSLRNLAAQNGVEPSLLQPTRGILLLTISPKLFNRVGYPLFIKPYSIFVDSLTKMEYLYIGTQTLRLDSNNYSIPVVEGYVNTLTFKANSDLINRFYIDNDKIADGSITVQSDGNEFKQVKSFYDTDGLNDNRQFLVKFTNDAQQPIVVYVKGLNPNSTVNISAIWCNGENGNIDSIRNFETDSIVDMYGNQISPNDNEIQIITVSGFRHGSNGTDENTLRNSIGFNHGVDLLFDNVSYHNFLSKFTTILTQDIKIDREYKQINYLYLFKKITIQNGGSLLFLIKQYKRAVAEKWYIISDYDRNELKSLIEEKEYCLSSSVIEDPLICKFAFQIEYNSLSDKEKHTHLIDSILYEEFAKFLYIRNHSINIELLFDKYMVENDIQFKYIIFNELIETKKIENKKHIDTPYIIKHISLFDREKDQSKQYIDKLSNGPFLPILSGSFEICDSNFNKHQLFFDVNHVYNKQ